MENQVKLDSSVCYENALRLEGLIRENKALTYKLEEIQRTYIKQALEFGREFGIEPGKTDEH